MGDDIKIPDGNFEVVREQGEYFKAGIKGIVALNKKITETNNNITELGKNIKFTAGEIGVFKEAICGIAEKMNDSSNKMLKASKKYFWGSIILTALVAFAAISQAYLVYWTSRPERSIEAYKVLNKWSDSLKEKEK